MDLSVLTITWNPVIDRTIRLDTLSFSEPNPVRLERVDPAGKGWNVSRILAAAGMASKAILLAGEDNVALYRDIALQEGLDLLPVLQTGAIRENMSIVVDGRGGLLKIDREGLFCTEEDFLRVRQVLLEQVSADKMNLLVLSGSLPAGVTPEQVIDLIAECRVKAPCRVTLDSRSFNYQQTLALRPYLIKPNRFELQVMVNRPLTTVTDLVAAAAQVHRDGISQLLVSMGPEGVLYLDGEVGLHLQVPAVDVRCDVGAGDSTLSGFLAATVRGSSNADAARLAAAFGTASVMREGTNPPRPEDIRWVYDRIAVHAIPVGCRGGENG